jgi:hypothetical protein
MPKETTSPKFVARTPKKIRSRITKRSRRVTFKLDDWYANATRSVSVASIGPGARSSGQWIAAAQERESEE